MRWDDLFTDLEAQFAAGERRDLDAEVADRTRRERATLGLYERLAAASGTPVGLLLAGRVRIDGTMVDVGKDWVLVGAATPVLVPFGAIAGVIGLGSRAASAGSGKRFGFGYALRGLSRDRAVVALTDMTGSVVTGTIDAVGADALDVSEHAPDVPRRAENITGRRLVPFAAIVCLRPA